MVAGTDPFDPDSVFRIQQFELSPGGAAQLTIPKPVARTVTIHRSSDLQVWNAVEDPVLDDLGNGLLKWTDPVTPVSGRVFYQITVN